MLPDHREAILVRDNGRYRGEEVRMAIITGLHHVTVNSGNPQENVDFYVGVLGMRLVKRTVNQDAPDTYHLFYADGAGTPGTELTFFPWAGMPRGRNGAGNTTEVALAVPVGSLGYWTDRLAGKGIATARSSRFGEQALTFSDPHGLVLALVETNDEREFSPWLDSPVPETQQIRGLHAIRVSESALPPTVNFLESGLGFELKSEEAGVQRFMVGTGGSGRIVDVVLATNGARAYSGTGSVHHVAFRVPDDAAEKQAQGRLAKAGVPTTEVIDRFWFKSIYFREPGGALFEIATDGPGFSVDEDVATLGEKLILPPFLERQRAQIERSLRPVVMPRTDSARTTEVSARV
jgi:glyoxalase family protein